MRKIFFILITGILVLMSSCRNDFEFEPSTGGLAFSRDTVYLDTVFTNIGSSTYRLKVYNTSDKDIAIPKVQLQKGNASKYRIMVDGMTGEDADNSGIGDGKIFNNVELLAKDSLYIFIEVTADVASANPLDFLYTDKIDFYAADGTTQDVDLVTLIQDAYFIYPQRSEVDNEFLYEAINLGVSDENENVVVAGSNLDENDPINGNEYNWSNTKPYVIYGYAFVPNGKTLTVNPGARVHFHANSGLIVGKDAILKINGENSITEALENEVIFEGDRLEPEYSDVPGQWLAIINYSTSTENIINHLTLKNATVGILSGNLATTTNITDFPKLEIKNSQFYNCSNVGILARKSVITGENIVGNNCGQAVLACTFGGTYSFTHCTFNNNWPSSSQVAVLANNYFETQEATYLHDLVSANFTNCIIYGSNQIEMFLEKIETDSVTTLFNYNFKNCLIRFNNINNQFTDNELFDFTQPNYLGSTIASNSFTNKPKFADVNNNKLWLTEDLSLPADETTVGTQDILGVTRNLPILLGAYQNIVVPE